MKLKSTMPLGQFVAIWEHNGRIWSDTYFLNESGNMFIYDDETDGFVEGVLPSGANMRFLTLKDLRG